MLYIKDDGTIRLTRGDTAELAVELTYDNSVDAYSIKSDDKLTLTVKKSVKDTAALIQKIVIGSNNIFINPVDTSSLAFGKYKYDVQLETADGKVYTVIEPSIFEVMEEVT